MASLVLAGAVVAAGCAGSSESSATALGKVAHVVAVNKVDGRTRDVVIDSPSVGEVRVRLLLPVGFEADPNRRWPVLYLLHGANDPDTYKCWTRSTDIAALTAGLPLLVVMPEGGTNGYYSNWFNEGRLNDLGIPADVNAYGPGAHSWPYWQRELHRTLPGIMRALQS